MSDDHDFDDHTKDHNNDDEDDKHRLKKHRKKIQWMIDYIEGKAGKAEKAVIKDDRETRGVIAYIEKLHDGLSQEVEMLKHHKKKVKNQGDEDKKPKKV
jgi:Uri superfamily endonuclease